MQKVQKGMLLTLHLGRAKKIEVQWQDGDLSSSKAFRVHYPDEGTSKVMLCGGHVAHAHTKRL